MDSQQTHKATGADVPAILIYEGEIIHDRGDMLSLTDMWKAAGSPENREPFNWSRKEGASFIEAVALSHNLPASQVMTKKVGKSGGTWAHWQVALAYAKYLSHDFHMWCNTVVRQRMEGGIIKSQFSPDLIEQIRRTDGISRMLSHKVTEIERTMAIVLTSIQAIAAVVQPIQPILFRYGKTAGQIVKDAGFGGVKGLSVWFGNRLEKMGCRIEHNGCAQVGLTKARLFDPDKADFFLENGGRVALDQKAAERRGQKSLRLVQPATDSARVQ